MTSTSPEHRATVDHLRLIKAAWAEILPELPEHLTRHQMDRYWYRTYIAAVRHLYEERKKNDDLVKGNQ